MSELTLLILRIAFLLMLWGFVFAVVYALRTDLFGQRVRRQPVADAAAVPSATVTAPPAAAPSQRIPTPANSLAHSTSPAATATSAKRLVITTGAKEGLELPLSNQPLTIGRSSESGLVIRDDYTSTHHARLMLLNDSWVIQDLDSTNGTFLDGTRVVVPILTGVLRGIWVGTTSFELRR